MKHDLPDYIRMSSRNMASHYCVWNSLIFSMENEMKVSTKSVDCLV
jgi:hypothetical protein